MATQSKKLEKTKNYYCLLPIVKTFWLAYLAGGEGVVAISPL